MIKKTILLVVLICLLDACSVGRTPAPAIHTPIPQSSTETGVPTSTFSSTPIFTSTFAASASGTDIPAPTSTGTLAADAWMQLPVIPEGISERVREIYARGQALGNRPNAFSKIGDCDTSASWFLDSFDQGSSSYSLGTYTNLQPVIDQFQGSYARKSLAAYRGFVAASVLSPLWSDPNQCQANETPLACEIRLNRPAFAFILLGTNDYNHEKDFEPNMRIILNTLIAAGVVPILATKADNLEGDESINATIARLAYEYDLPLWNFWRAVQPLPSHGLQVDQSHLTFASNYFNNPDNMKKAWPWRNLTALQMLDMVWRSVAGQS